MHPRPFRLLLNLALVAAVPLLLCGCAAVRALRPDHVTIYGEHSEAETTGGPHPLSTSTNKVGASASYDLSKR